MSMFLFRYEFRARARVWTFLLLVTLLQPAMTFSQNISDQSLLQGAGGDPRDGLSSGRYEIRKDSQVKKAPKKQLKRRVASVLEPQNSEKAQKKSSLVGAIAEGDKPARLICEQPAEELKQELVAPSFADQIKSLFVGESRTIQQYLDQLNSDDNRLNQIELELLPGWFAYSSASDETYRNFSTKSPVVLARAEFWWTPFIGTYGIYGTSFQADVTDNISSTSRSSANQEWIEAGIDLRQYFGVTRKANSITFGLQYFESKFSPPSYDVFRVRTKSVGVGLHFGARLPVSPYYSWTIGGSFYPKIQHSEFGTALALNSGTGIDGSEVGVFLGGEFKMSRSDEIHWRVQTTVEKDQFSGNASSADPSTGVVPSGVSVTQTMTMLNFGFMWGH